MSKGPVLRACLRRGETGLYLESNYVHLGKWKRQGMLNITVTGWEGLNSHNQSRIMRIHIIDYMSMT